MITIEARNAHEALPDALHLLYMHGIKEDSRNGPVLRAPGPVVTVLSHPHERLTFYPWRDSNPFFLHVEALWMLAGRDDLKQLTPYVGRMADYSDDGGKTSPGAYGKRWRDWNGGYSKTIWPDQLNWVAKRLRENPGDRRVVIQMWDAHVDIERADHGGKDVPCNLMILPWVSDGALHLTVFNRSNDIVWGLYSANAVQFSTLLEYLAGRLGLRVGTLTTVSNNFHAYLNTVPSREAITRNVNPYPMPTMPLCDLWPGLSPISTEDDARAERVFQEDLNMLFEYKPEETQLKARSGYIRQVTMPMVLAHKHFRTQQGEERFTIASEILGQMPPCDWKMAAQQWMRRRHDAFLNVQEGLNSAST